MIQCKRSRIKRETVREKRAAIEADRRKNGKISTEKTMSDKILKELFGLRDIKYRDFQSKLIPTVDKETIIGVRTPELRNLSKRLLKNGECAEFLKELPHGYFDENQLHAFILSDLSD